MSLLDEVGVVSNVTDSAECVGKTMDIASLMKAMNRTLTTSIESRITYHYGLLLSQINTAIG